LSGCVAQEESLPLSCLCPKKDNSAHLKEDWPVNGLFMEGARNLTESLEINLAAPITRD
jgi:hypothetical protein